MPITSTPVDFLPIALMFIVAIGFVATTLFVTHKLGPKHSSKIKEEAFECGIESQGNARTPFSIKYFLVAILFVLFGNCLNWICLFRFFWICLFVVCCFLVVLIL